MSGREKELGNGGGERREGKEEVEIEWNKKRGIKEFNENGKRKRQQ